jgi:D-arabinose 1-dehydrogenase-like Zn-dependent alcohol dehydrogenase
MCAGAAVYSAINQAGVRWPDRVGILSMGGLGHLAVQFASKMGCQVVVFSHSAAKEAEARRLGALEFYNLAGTQDTDPPVPVDHLLLTGSNQPDWARIIPLVRRGGTISAMTVDPVELQGLSCMDMVMNTIKIQGSLPATRRLHREMLAFAARHGIAPVVEIFPFDEQGINAAADKLRSGKMRYRGVMERSG